MISIHAAQEGCDAATHAAASPSPKISIHAAQEGCDNRIKLPLRQRAYFNPRSPRGLRLYCTLYRHKIRRYFNPRSPRGLRPLFPALCSRRRYFNPRSPRGLRPLIVVNKNVPVEISIHAAQEGCDWVAKLALKALRKFQSTQPKRAATITVEDGTNIRIISIHAAQEGCDSIRINCNYYLFYSYKSAKLTFLLN